MKHTTKQVLHGSTALAASQVVANLAAFLLAWVIARGMGSEAYGVFAAAYALAVSLAGLADTGIRLTLIREVAREPQAWRQLAWNALLISGLLGLLVAMGFYTASLYERGAVEAQALRFWLLAYALLWTATRISLGVVAGHQRLLAVSVWAAVERLAAACLVAVIVFASWGGLLEIAVALLLLEAMVLLVLWVWMFRQAWPVQKQREQRLAGFARAAIPFGVFAVVGGILGRLDLISLGYQQAPESVGQYAAAQTLAMVAVFFGVSLAGALFPALSSFGKNKDVAQARGILEPALGLLCLVMVTAAAVLAAGAQTWLRWIYGDSFAVGDMWLVAFAFASPIMAVGSIIGAALGAWGRQAALARWSVIVLALAVPAYWLLGGAFGMAMVVAIAIGVQLLVTWRAWLWLVDAELIDEMRWMMVKLALILGGLGGLCLLLPDPWDWLVLPLAPLVVIATGICRMAWIFRAWELAWQR